jgi:hypothetical protein
MQGNIVAAARWLGSSMVLASVVLVAGMRWTISADAGRSPGPARTPSARVASPARATDVPAPSPSDPKPDDATTKARVDGEGVPILDPIPAEFDPPNCLDPPSEDEVWERIPRPKAGEAHYIETQRNNARFLIEKIGDTVDPCKVYPMAGPCRLHHCHFKCTVSFDQLSWSDYPIPFSRVEHRVEVVYIDKDYLTRCRDCGVDINAHQ